MEARPEYEQFHKLMDRYAKQDVMVAFSGGADSALLLKAACEAAKRDHTTVYAVTVETKLHPAGDLLTAENMAREMGAVHKILEVDVFSDGKMRDNPRDRCYLCKKNMFEAIRRLADGLGVNTVLEGTNEDDMHTYRPGRKALAELQVISPLAQCHMTKQMVRELAAAYGISAADRPASPCLATRIPYGSRLDEEILARIDRGERYLRSLDLYNVRLRVHENIARIETDLAFLGVLLEHREEIVKELKALGFTYVAMDLEGFRSGSMDEMQKK